MSPAVYQKTCISETAPSTIKEFFIQVAFNKKPKRAPMKHEKKVLSLSVLAIAFLWLVDSLVDAFIFKNGTFLDCFLLGLSAHELYFRILFSIGPLIFALFISNYMEKEKSAQKKLAQAVLDLRREKAKNEAIIAAIGEGISILDTDFKVIYQNKAHIEHAGNHIGEHCYEGFLDREGVCDICPVEMSFKDGKIHRAEIYNEKRNMHVEITASPLKDQNGRIMAGIELVRDISARKTAEEKLKLFSRAVEEAPDGVQIVNMNGFVQYSNRAVQEIYGFGAEEFAGKHVNEMNVDPEMASNVILPWIYEHGKWTGEILVKHKDGTQFPIWLTAALVKNEKMEPVAMIGIIRDISQRRKAEEERENLIKELQTAITEIKTLRGLIPICAWCKKVRNDAGYWESVEDYLEKHSDAHFTHGICEACLSQAFDNMEE